MGKVRSIQVIPSVDVAAEVEKAATAATDGLIEREVL